MGKQLRENFGSMTNQEKKMNKEELVAYK